MTWLLAHMWLALLLAAGFGGLIGWSFRHWSQRGGQDHAFGRSGNASADAEAAARVVELETQLAAERDELASLRAVMATASGEASGVAEEPEEGSLEWRNRYLESRVRFLEKQIVEAEERAVEQPASPEPEEDEGTRLIWRNRYLEGRVRYLEDELAKGGSLTLATPQAMTAVKTKPAAGQKPLTLDAPRGGQADNLRQIGGVGPKIERVLNDLGIFHFDQIAEWSEKEIAWVNSEISFKGRIERENWVGQAAALAKGLQPQAKGR